MLRALRDPRVALSTVEHLFHNSSQFANFALSRGLYVAVEAGNVKVAAMLIQNALSKGFGLSKLYLDVLTTSKGKLEGQLQARSVDKKARQYWDISPLHAACINPNTAVLRQMLSISGTVNEPDRLGRTLLHFAACCETVDNVCFLLSRGASLFAVDKAGVSALELAVKFNRLESVRMLTDAMNKEHKARLGPADEDAQVGDDGDDGEIDNNQSNNARTPGRGSNSKEKKRRTTGGKRVQPSASSFDGCRKDKGGNTVMHYAARYANSGVFSLLLDMGGDVEVINKNKQTPLMIASMFGNTEAVKLLLARKNVNVDYTNARLYTSLHQAAKNGHFAICQMLLRHGADPNALDSSGHTPAHFAAAYGWVNILQLLHTYGADFSLCSHWKTSVLSIAVIKGSSACVFYLLTVGGSDVNLADAKGRHLLHHICGCLGDASLVYVRQLIKHNANVNATDLEGSTPLLTLIRSRSSHARVLDVATVLLDAGTDLNKADNRGNTPLMVAVEVQATALVKLLLSRHAAMIGRAEDTRETLLHHWFTRIANVSEYWSVITSRPPEEVVGMLRANANNGQTPLLAAVAKVQITASGLPPGAAKGLPHTLHHLGLLQTLIQSCLAMGVDINQRVILPDEVVQTKLKERHQQQEKKQQQRILLRRNTSTMTSRSVTAPVVGTTTACSSSSSAKEAGESGGDGGNIKESASSRPQEREDHGSAIFGPELDGFVTRGLDDGPDISNNPASEVVPEMDVEWGGGTMLHMAACLDTNVGLIKMLLGLGADATLRDGQGRTPFFIAVQSGALANARLLLEMAPATATVPTSTTQETPLMQVIRQTGQPNTTQIRYDLNCSVASGHYPGEELLALLLSSPLQLQDIDHRDLAGRTALYFAVALNHEKLVKMLLSQGANPSLPNLRTGATPLMRALLLSKADSNATFEAERALVKAGADLFARDWRGRSLMHYAFVAVNAQDGDRSQATPSVPGGQDTSIEAVSNICSLNPRIEVDVADCSGQTPLALAAKEGAIITARYLLQRGANVNVRDAMGNSPLAHALINGHANFAVVLIEHGLDMKKETVSPPIPRPKVNKSGWTIRSTTGPMYCGAYLQAKFKWCDADNQCDSCQITQRDYESSPYDPTISCFRFILERGYLGLAYLLLDKSDMVEIFTAFADALATGKYQLVLTILSKTDPTRVKALNNMGQNLFHIFAQFFPPTQSHNTFHDKFAANIADALSEQYGLDAFLIDSEGRAPMHYAAQWRSFFFDSMVQSSSFTPERYLQASTAHKGGSSSFALCFRYPKCSWPHSGQGTHIGNLDCTSSHCHRAFANGRLHLSQWRAGHFPCGEGDTVDLGYQ